MFHDDDKDQEVIKTYDGVMYGVVIPPETCEFVLSKDCSALSLFTVLTKMVEVRLWDYFNTCCNVK